MNPPPVSGPYQQMQDANHLRLLVIFHYLIGALLIMGGIALIFGSFFMVQFMETAVTMPPTVVPTPPTPGGGIPPPTPVPVGPPEEMMEGLSNIILFFYGGSGLAIAVLGILTLISAFGLSKRRWQTLSLIVAGCQCLMIPIGTILGVFTFMVLLRPSVAEEYKRMKTETS